MSATLHDLLAKSASAFPDRPAVSDPTRQAAATYAEFHTVATRIREQMTAAGVAPGDRVGVLGKSIPSLATIFGALAAGAAYVPVDATAPIARGTSILTDCGVAVAVVPVELADAYAEALGAEAPIPLEGAADLGIDYALLRCPAATDVGTPPEGLAYILYTSGSTGKPKGVMHTHTSALSFVDWCSETFQPTEADVFSSHAPFHFDLSILDIYVSLKHGAKLVLIGDDLGKHPTGLARLIANEQITMWYSTPSILRLLVEFGRLEKLDFALRVVNYAGEVYPMPHLRRLFEVWPTPRYYNLFGPTETNVCTFYANPVTIPEGREEPFPIGVPSSGDECTVRDADGHVVATGTEGELCVRGGSVMSGYWNMPERTAESLFEASDGGAAWYRTGDLVVETEGQCYTFVGRRDRMIKRRGYRIEPGEIESVMHRHPDVVEVAVTAGVDAEGSVVIIAHVATRDGEALPGIEFKKWCADNLPRYMIPDRFSFSAALPKTSTDKVDYQKLKDVL